jgi:hypothetical protein
VEPAVDGLQSALIINNLGAHLGFVTGATATDTPGVCTNLPQVAPGQNRLQNGLQIFSGSVPIYRGRGWWARSACPATASTRTT